MRLILSATPRQLRLLPKKDLEKASDFVNNGTIFSSGATFDEDTIFNFTGANAITISDSDDGELLNVSLSVTNGVLTLANTSGLTVLGNNSKNISILGGSVAAINAALAGLSFTPPLNEFGTFTITTTDLSESLSDTDQTTLTVNAAGIQMKTLKGL